MRNINSYTTNVATTNFREPIDLKFPPREEL